MLENFKNPHFFKWFIYAPIGLSLFAFGLCLVVELGYLKHQGAAFWTWFGWGTLALIITNAGIAFVGDAVKHRVLYEISKKSKEA